MNSILACVNGLRANALTTFSRSRRQVDFRSFEFWRESRFDGSSPAAGLHGDEEEGTRSTKTMQAAVANTTGIWQV